MLKNITQWSSAINSTVRISTLWANLNTSYIESQKDLEFDHIIQYHTCFTPVEWLEKQVRQNKIKKRKQQQTFDAFAANIVQVNTDERRKRRSKHTKTTNEGNKFVYYIIIYWCFENIDNDGHWSLNERKKMKRRSNNNNLNRNLKSATQLPWLISEHL